MGRSCPPLGGMRMVGDGLAGASLRYSDGGRAKNRVFRPTARMVLNAVALTASAITSTACNGKGDSPKLIHLSVPQGALEASIAPEHGGELASLRVRIRGQWQELLYRGMNYSPAPGWTGKAPVLWPATGRNFPNPVGSAQQDALGWVFRGKTYPLPIHGFARDQAWEVTGQGTCGNATWLRLVLHDNSMTRSVYPFGFSLTSDYILGGETLYLRQTVHADTANDAAMPFSIGNHITFRVPLLAGGTGTTIATPATKEVLNDATGRPTGQIRAVAFDAPRALSDFTWIPAVPLSGYPQHGVFARVADASGIAVTVSHTEDTQPSGTPVLFNLWGDPQNGYFAAEPWVGKQNSLMTGDGTISLAPGKSFQWTVAVQVTDRKAPADGAPTPPRCPIPETAGK